MAHLRSASTLAQVAFLALLLLVLLSGKVAYAQCGCVQCLESCDLETHHCDSSCDCVPNVGSPIIIDTRGEGFRLTSANDGVMFDIRGDGRPIQLAWTAATSANAFLALDRNGNGKIDNGKELFGNFTDQPPCPDGGGACRNGYRALAEFDKPQNGGNGDGIIDQRDAIFSHLLLWIDENHDGISQPDELHTLPELGVSSLALKYKESRRTDRFGNQFRYKDAVNPDPKDGESKDGRWAYDVFFMIAGRDGKGSLPSSVEGINGSSHFRAECEPIPTSETTALFNPPTYLYTEGSFQMTLNPGADNYDDHYVTENNYNTGTDTCYWAGAKIANPPSVVGSSWLVGENGSGHNQYGVDSIGFDYTGVNYIQQNAAQNGIDFPCVVTFYQEMTYETAADTWWEYAENIDTQTIGSNTVKVCRADVCTAAIPF
jgi:hypothetical protein